MKRLLARLRPARLARSVDFRDAGDPRSADMRIVRHTQTVCVNDLRSDINSSADSDGRDKRAGIAARAFVWRPLFVKEKDVRFNAGEGEWEGCGIATRYDDFIISRPAKSRATTHPARARRNVTSDRKGCPRRGRGRENPCVSRDADTTHSECIMPAQESLFFGTIGRDKPRGNFPALSGPSDLSSLLRYL